MAEKKTPTAESIYREYEKGLSFNAQIDLNETVQTNENFFIGKQWEGVESNGLPTPTFNFLKRVVLFTVASITSDNLRMHASALDTTGDRAELEKLSGVINREFDALMERNDIVGLLREYMRNAAVDGDGCLYTYWDPEIETGHPVKGAIVTEVIDNTRVFFGNPNDRRVQRQPHIIIASREMVEEVRDRAKENGGKDPGAITPDNDDTNLPSALVTDDKVTVLLRMWRDKETGTIWAAECTKKAMIRKPWDTKLKLYPVTWLNWDYVQDCYHGQAMVTGLIPNQVFVNKLYAMSQISMMTTAYPKIVYDKTRVAKWDNRVGAAIGVVGGDMNSVAKVIDPASISPQIAQFIEMTVEMTQAQLGATSVALGDTRPDNTSAIIALQRAASTPHEITKQNLYQSLEDLGRIYVEFMGEYYGKRIIEMDIPSDMADVAAFAGIPATEKMPVDFDFETIKGRQFDIKLDVGASAYWSEIASMQTLDNLLMQNKIDIVDYLERVPDGYITKRQELLDKLKGGQAAMMAAQGGAGGGMGMDGTALTQNGGGGTIPLGGGDMPLPVGGGGDGALQRAVREGAGV